MLALPDDTIRLILRELPLASLLQLACTCSFMATLAKRRIACAALLHKEPFAIGELLLRACLLSIRELFRCAYP